MSTASGRRRAPRSSYCRLSPRNYGVLTTAPPQTPAACLRVLSERARAPAAWGGAQRAGREAAGGAQGAAGAGLCTAPWNAAVVPRFPVNYPVGEDTEKFSI